MPTGQQARGPELMLIFKTGLGQECSDGSRRTYRANETVLGVFIAVNPVGGLSLADHRISYALFWPKAKKRRRVQGDEVRLDGPVPQGSYTVKCIR